MMKFTYQYNEDEPKVEFTLSPEISWMDALQQFEHFLRGAGYLFDGHFDIVYAEGEEPKDETPK